jgi:protein-tyrosine-phosphatase
MAVGLARRRLGERAEVRSAGLAAEGGPASEDAVLVMRIVYQVDISDHVARAISEYDLASFDHIVALDYLVYARLKALGVIPEERLYGWDIADPLGRGYDAFKEAARRIDRRLEQWIAGLGLDA